MRKLLDLLKSMYDVVLIDGTPCMVIADSIALSSMVDSTILVVECCKTKINDIRKTKKSIEDVNGNILGAILNKSEAQRGKYYGKRYGYYYGNDVEKTEEIAEKQKINSLDEVIQIAENNIKEEYNVKNESKDENIAKNENILKTPELTENNQQTEDKIENIKNEIFIEIKKMKNAFDELKRDYESKQINSLTKKVEILEEEQKNNNKYMIKIIENIQGAQARKIEDIEQIKEELIAEIDYLKHEISDLREKQVSNNDVLLEKIENMDYDKKIEQINNKIQKNITKNTGNIISFESLKNRRKSNKKVFKMDETIEYEDLQRLSIDVIEFYDNSILNEIMRN